MSDPVVHLTNGVPDSGTGNITTLGQTILDQAASGAAVPANVKMVGLSDGTNAQRWLTAIAQADGVNGNNSGCVVNYVYNGTTFDRLRGDATNGAYVQTKDGANATIGTKADAKSTATDTTAVSLMAVSKQISASAQTIATNSGAALPAGTNLIGKAGIDQTTPGTTNAVSLAQINAATTLAGNGVTGTGSQRVTIASDNTPFSVNATAVDQYSQYETVAASQTAQALGATGATGDYLAGVLVFPGTAGCGVVTILDNATTIGTFAGGGTTALPSLVPFMIPVGLVSVSGAWKITTGANVTAVGIGKFT